MKKNSVLFLSRDSSWGFNSPVVFENCKGIITTSIRQNLEKCLIDIDKALQKGYYLAGFLSYDAGEVFQKISSHHEYRFPLIWFGLYDSPSPVPSFPAAHYRISRCGFSTSQKTYSQKIKKIKELISIDQIHYL